MQNTLLVVDDEVSICNILQKYFTARGYKVLAAPDGRTAIESCASTPIDLVLLDLRLPDMSGFEVLREVKASSAHTGVIIITAHGDVETAVRAMQSKADNFVLKPIDLATLETLITKTLANYQARARMEYLKKKVSPLEGADYQEKLLLPPELYHAISLLAENSSTTALILGETGTGKGMIAAAIHELSPRRPAEFVDINCAGLKGDLLESELFGHERGAFTDAKNFKRGLLEIADGGTVFLDEVGEMPPAVQAKLLKVLESKSFRRLGGTANIEVDVRIIAATNADLEQAVKEGRFRSDLFYRLNVMPINLPPLRERAGDIAALAERFLAEFRRQFNKRIEGISAEAVERLRAYAWPGNIRELRNVIERAALLCPGPAIMPEHLPENLRQKSPAVTRTRVEIDSLKETERRQIAEALKSCGGNRSHAAQALGIHRSTLIKKIKLYELD